MMMIILSCLVLLFAPLLLGTAIAKITGERDVTAAYAYMLGFMTLYILFTAMTWLIAKRGMPFTTLCMLFSCLLLLFCGLSLAFAYQDLQTLLRIRISKRYIGVGILVLLQIVKIVKSISSVQDETVINLLNTIQSGNVIGEGTQAVNVFYTYLSNIFALPQETVLYALIPTWLLLVSYLIYDLWADYLIEKEKKPVFLLLYSLLLLFGDTLFTTISSHFYHQGWSGETVVIAVLIPFAIYLCLQDRYHKLFPIGILLLSVFGFVTIQIGNPVEPPLSEVTNVMLHVNQTVNTYGKYQALYYAALLFLFVRNREKDKKLLVYNIIVLLLLWNPLVVKGCMWIFPQLTTYWQFLWLLPIHGVLAYVGTLVYDNVKEKVRENVRNK